MIEADSVNPTCAKYTAPERPLEEDVLDLCVLDDGKADVNWIIARVSGNENPDHATIKDWEVKLRNNKNIIKCRGKKTDTTSYWQPSADYCITRVRQLQSALALADDIMNPPSPTSSTEGSSPSEGGPA